jgi:hypothetical protein
MWSACLTRSRTSMTGGVIEQQEISLTRDAAGVVAMPYHSPHLDTATRATSLVAVVPSQHPPVLRPTGVAAEPRSSRFTSAKLGFHSIAAA